MPPHLPNQPQHQFIPTQPTPASAATAQPTEALAAQSQKSPKYCNVCTTTGKLCPTEYPIPFKADWSDDSEEEKDSQQQNKNEDNFSDIEVWDGDLEKHKKLEVQELKNNDNQTSQKAPNPHPHLILKLISQPSKPFMDRFSNQISVSSEEGQKEETF